jgi:hypothetical protein
MGADTDGNGLLTYIGVAGAMDQSALMRPDQLLLAASDPHHLPEEFEQLVFEERNGGHEMRGFPSRLGDLSPATWRTEPRKGPGEDDGP